MGGSRKSIRGGPTLTLFFLGGGGVYWGFFSLMRGGRIQIPLLAGHQWPASKTPFKWRRWRADDSPTLNAGLVAL